MTALLRMSIMLWYIIRQLEAHTIDVLRKVSAEEIKDNIIRYGLTEDATDDVKKVAKQMEKEEVVAQEEEQHYHRGR